MNLVLNKILELLAKWVVFYTGDPEFTGRVTFNFNQGKPKKGAIYLYGRAKV